MGLIDYSEINTVYHVTHINNSFSIFDNGIINADIVRDESKLKLNRIKVTWLSPNHWTPGYRYGNVRFAYNFQDLIKDKNIYYIETMHKYNPIAHRFLVTHKEYKFQLLEDFCKKHPKHEIFINSIGKLCQKGDTLELMLEDDLLVKQCNEIDFVLHHNKQCCIDPYNCKDRGFQDFKARPLVCAYLLSKSDYSSTVFDKDDVIDGYNTLIRSLNKCKFENSIADCKLENKVLSESLLLFSNRKIEDWIKHISQLKSKDKVESLLKDRILKVFNIEINKKDTN